MEIVKLGYKSIGILLNSILIAKKCTKCSKFKWLESFTLRSNGKTDCRCKYCHNHNNYRRRAECGY